MRRARLNRRGKIVCNCSRMRTWIQERNYILTHFLAEKRNPNEQNEFRATWLIPQLALHQFARPIVIFRLSALGFPSLSRDCSQVPLLLSACSSHPIKIFATLSIGWARIHLSNRARLGAVGAEPFRQEKLRPLVYQVRLSRLLQSKCAIEWDWWNLAPPVILHQRSWSWKCYAQSWDASWIYTSEVLRYIRSTGPYKRRIKEEILMFVII